MKRRGLGDWERTCVAVLTVGSTVQDRNCRTIGRIGQRRFVARVRAETERLFPKGSTAVQALGTWRCEQGDNTASIREASAQIQLSARTGSCRQLANRAEKLARRLGRVFKQHAVEVRMTNTSGASCRAFVKPTGKRERVGRCKAVVQRAA